MKIVGWLCKVCCVGMLAQATVWAGAAASGEWPNFRGPTNDGISAEKGWTAANPKQLFKIQVGEGYSGITAVGGKIFTMGNAGGNDTVWCLDGTTGAVVWKHSYPCGTDQGYPGPRGAPVVDAGKVYSISRKGHIFCLDGAKGTVLWQKDAKQLVGAKAPSWDFSGSPLVYGNLVIFNLNENGVALDKATGNLAWKSNGVTPGYATPVPFDIGGVKGVAVFGANKITGVNPASGVAIWSFDWKTAHDVNAADPVFQGDKVFISSGYGRGGAGLQIKGAQATKLWENKEIAAHGSSPVALNGHVYGITGQYGQGNQPLKCVDIATGAAKWSQAGLGGQLILVDGKLVILTYGGKLVVAEASPAGYKELASAQVLDKTCWTQPTLAGGKFYARNKEGDLVGVDLSGK